LNNTAELLRRCALVAAIALSAGPLQAQTTAAAEPTVAVDSFRVTGNSLLDMNRIQDTLRPFRGKRTLEELRRAADAVQRLYAEAGYGGVVAFLPPQQGGEAGVVMIRVVEGKVSSVKVLDARFHSPDNIRNSLPDLQAGSTPRLRRIDTQIELANENPSKHVQVLLRPGQQPGEVAADLTVLDRAPTSYSLSLDDTGNSRTGRMRVGAGWQHANVWDIDDVASLQYQTSLSKPGKVAVLSAFYRHPVPGLLMVLDGYLAFSDVDGGGGNTSAGNLRINGRGNLAGLRATWLLPRWGEVDHRVSLALDRREYLNRCDIDGLANPACGAAGQDVAVTPVSVDYALRGSTPVAWTLTFTALGNLKLGGSNASAADFELQRAGARQGFGALRVASTAQGDVADWQLRGRLSLQWTRQALVAGEQFGLGGAVSVRGYEERELVGDKGVAATLELGSPELLTRATADQPSLRGFAFVDGGSVANNLNAPCNNTDKTRCSLASAGLGLSFERQRLQARLAAAVALKEGTLTRRNDTRAHFSANLSF
jgi:hemolysin activation/secretion protein